MFGKLTYEELEKRIQELEQAESERKEAEEALNAAHQYTRGLIEASLDALVTISAKGKITDVNKATEVITGMSRKEIIGTDFSNY
ncbi:PAS domain-containing protein, partial [Desulfobacula sp.]|uniref:PAS domain-containing protein n=2 Tax=Desulfobacula sp. TaxID=2593537 RepID=UPI002622AD40